MQTEHPVYVQFIVLLLLCGNIESWRCFPLISLFLCRINQAEEQAIEIVKEDPDNPDTYKIICAENDDAVIDTNYEVASNANDAWVEIYEFRDDECTIKKPPADEPSTANAIATRLSDGELKKSIARLLKIVVDEDILTKFGYPKAPIERVLSSVIKQCGKSPVDNVTCPNLSSKLRENVKLLFTSVIDDESIKEMLNNNTIDEVICHVIKLSESN